MLVYCNPLILHIDYIETMSMQSSLNVYNGVKRAWKQYQDEKKRYKPLVQEVTQSNARTHAQKLSQELNVLESNLSSYKAIQRRTRPSMNSRVSKGTKVEVDMTIKLMQRYVADYQSAYTQWKRLVKAVPKKRRVSLFQLTTKMGPKFVGRVNAFFKYHVKWIETETSRKSNVPVLPFKTSVVNVRNMTINNAKGVASVSTRLRRATTRADTLARDIERAKYNLAIAANNKMRATKKWKQAEAAIKKASDNARALKTHQAENVNFYISQITQLQDRLAERGREAEASKMKAEHLTKLLSIAERNRIRLRSRGRSSGSNSNSSSNSVYYDT